MFKMKSKSTLLLMLLGAVVGSLGVTSASAEKARIVNTGKHVDNLIHKVDIRNLSYFDTRFDYSSKPYKMSQNRYQTYKLKRSLKIANMNKHKEVILPKGSVVTGLNDGKGNITYISNPSLSLKNQKLVFKTLGNWHGSLPIIKNNGGAQQPYTRNTAFSYKSSAMLPFLSVKSNKPFYDAEGLSLPFVSISADSQLIYHTKGSKYKPTRYAKIKKFKLTHSAITYYLAKPVKGVATKKVRSGKTHLYRATFKMGHVFQMMFADNDTDGYSLTVNNGRQEFFISLYQLGWKYVGSIVGLTGADAVSPTDAKIATDYVQGLY
ncbi:hypothetical protein [Levilactobacillus humaensis]|uniref:hypothetical protein n=1 Tax=Levilactobacillus humaensis TaxID=2950375 RepID=UPI0021C46490|nr:hypothetical protein [Levilactobacillus humaensis]